MIGRTPWNNNDDWGGIIRDVRIWNKSRSDKDIKKYYNFKCRTHKSLKFFHHMVDDSTGDIIMDIEIVAVLFDLKKRKSMVVPEDFRIKASKLVINN